MRTLRWSAPSAIVSVGILALVLLLAPSGKDPAQATNFGLGPISPLPWTGTDVGVNLCDTTFTTVLKTSAGTGLVAFDALTPNFEHHDDTGTSANVYELGEGIYKDADNDDAVSDGDTRLNDVAGYDAGSTAACPGDADCAVALVDFDAASPNFEKHTDAGTNPNVYDVGEAVFGDADDSDTVSTNDVNLLGYADPDYVGATSGTKNFTADCFNNSTNAANASPDYLQEFLIPAPGANFAQIVTFAPPDSTFAPGPGHRDPNHGSYPHIDSVDFNAGTDPDLGAVMGVVSSDPVVLSLSLGGGMSPCNQSVVVEFTMMNSTVDFLNTDGTAVDPNKVVWQKPFDVAAGEGNFLEPLAQPDPATIAPNQLPMHVTHFPGYLMELLDPDLVNPELIDIDDPGGPKTYAEVDGPKLPIQPLARYGGRALVAGNDQILEFMVFSPGQLAELGELENHSYAQMTELFGYPTFVVLNAPNVPVSPSSIQDFCAPLGTTTLILGTGLENQGTAGCAGDISGADTWELSCVNTPRTDGTTDNIRYQNPGSGAGILDTNTNLYATFVAAQRDAEDDGVENNMDSCPLDDNSSGGSNPWNPRLATPGDGDNDGLPLPCDDVCGMVPATDCDSLLAGGFEINEDEANAGHPFECATCVAGSTDNTVTVTGVPAWTVDEFKNRIAETPIGGQQFINSNTVDTLTLAGNWIANPVAGALTIYGDTLGNRQDNCPVDVNQGQFEQELVSAYPEDGGPRTDSMGDLCDPNDTTVDGHYHATLRFHPFCVSSDLATDDSDSDGWCDGTVPALNTEALLGSNPASAASTPESVYLDIRYGLARQSLMNRAPACSTPYNAACTTMSVDVYASLAWPFITDCEPGSVVCDEPEHGVDGGAHVPVGTLTNPYPHPDTGEPVGGVAMFCSDGVDNDDDGDADRNDTDCMISLPPSKSPNFPNLTTEMKADLNSVLPDHDNDGEVSWKEIVRLTDPLKECPETGLNNDALDPWTFDIDDSGKISGGDVFAIFPEWLKEETTNSFRYRYDIDGSGKISGGDVFAIFPQWLKEAQTEFVGAGCPPP